MISVLILAALIWWGGGFLGMGSALRRLLLLVLYGAIITVQLTLPETAPLRVNLGGSVVPWLLAGALGVAISAYAYGVRWLKERAKGNDMSTTDEKKGAFTPTELNRYARHIVLREIGGAGQKKLKAAKVLVIGAGGLGAPALQYLAAAGVGTIGVIDDDVVENANLQRQVIHSDANIGMPKVFSAQAAMEAQNPYVSVKPYHRRLGADIASELFAEYDLILDGTDNFDTRYLANRVAVELGKPLISGALTQWEGQISLYHPAAGGPCYQCIFPEAPAPGLAPACAEAGVIGPLPGVVGAMMAVEALKHITGSGETLRGAMLIYDALYAETRRIALKPRADCPVCGSQGAA
ncbi:molybdopterin-synthase adenylyltransferase MoeB [Epibacterium sp. SM1979]|uniref:Molybdopterin-synthase adenylyltransferase n=1 Tax=Tritonibacter litoralis TaxID=2662264 RepID=A0A843YJX8_9RHOB|nr:molybdopterin-synthase adenylyltransferase MoeB [Tritonibacter litoralis]MQQ09734.1 molybdopterin-synthase adenylyltransferase MoeB [Tritonibacter litoralis]